MALFVTCFDISTTIMFNCADHPTTDLARPIAYSSMKGKQRSEDFGFAFRKLLEPDTRASL